MKLGMIGFSGKMGNIVYEYLKQRGHEFVFLCDVNNPLEKIKDVEVEAVIDFSTPASLCETAERFLKLGVPVLSGTTGISKATKEQLGELARNYHTSITIMANFLPSINDLYHFLESVESLYDNIYIDEIHHESKKDAPSGTALFLREAISPQKDVRLTAKRVKIFIYEHQITLVNDCEEMTINHRVYSKIGYARGVEKVLNDIKSYVGLKTIM